MIASVMGMAVAAASAQGFTSGPEFEAFRACIVAHRTAIRQPAAPRLGSFEADVRAINRACRKERPAALRAYKRALIRFDPRTYGKMSPSDWEKSLDAFARSTLYAPEIASKVAHAAD